MSKTKRTRKRYIKYAVILLVFVLLVTGVLWLLSRWEEQRGIFPTYDTISSESEAVFKYNDIEYLPKDNIETVLIMGLDKFDIVSDEDPDVYNNDRQTDFLMLLVIDNDTLTCNAIQINRDTMAEMDILGVAGQKIGTVNKQIALAHTYGNGKHMSCRNTVSSVSKLLLGTDIDHYISLTMDAVPVFNDLVGGVEITVLDDFSDVDPTLVKGETVTLLGDNALSYVRSRYGLEDSSNERRMVRQRQYLEALSEKAKLCAENDENFVVNASLEISDYLVSDCTVSDLQTLFEKISSYEFEKIHTMEGTYVVGERYMEFYHDGNALADIIVELFYKTKDAA